MLFPRIGCIALEEMMPIVEDSSDVRTLIVFLLTTRLMLMLMLMLMLLLLLPCMTSHDPPPLCLLPICMYTYIHSFCAFFFWGGGGGGKIGKKKMRARAMYSVSLFSNLLNEIIRSHEGEDVVNCIEKLRVMAATSHSLRESGAVPTGKSLRDMMRDMLGEMQLSGLLATVRRL